MSKRRKGRSIKSSKLDFRELSESQCSLSTDGNDITNKCDPFANTCLSCSTDMGERFEKDVIMKFIPKNPSDGYGSKSHVPIPGLYPEIVLPRRKGYFVPPKNQDLYITKVSDYKLTRYGLTVYANINDDPEIKKIEGYD